MTKKVKSGKVIKRTKKRGKYLLRGKKYIKSIEKYKETRRKYKGKEISLRDIEEEYKYIKEREEHFLNFIMYDYRIKRGLKPEKKSIRFNKAVCVYIKEMVVIPTEKD